MQESPSQRSAREAKKMPQGTDSIECIPIETETNGCSSESTRNLRGVTVASQNHAVNMVKPWNCLSNEEYSASAATTLQSLPEVADHCFSLHILPHVRYLRSMKIRASLQYVLGVSKNGGTPIIHLIGFSIINHPFWDTPIFGNTLLVKHWFIKILKLDP